MPGETVANIPGRPLSNILREILGEIPGRTPGKKPLKEDQGRAIAG